MSEETIQKFLAGTECYTIALETTPIAGIESPEAEEGHEGGERQAAGAALLGGVPFLPEGFNWPKDRQGNLLQCLAQLDLNILPAGQKIMPTTGLLTIFRSPAVLTMPVKDNKAFSLFYQADCDYSKLKMQNSGSSSLPGRTIKPRASWTVSEDLQGLHEQLQMSEESKAKLLQSVQKFNQDNLGGLSQKNRLLGADLPQLNEQKQICAFACGGITHTAQRAKDSHYSHLIDDAQNWILFARFDEASLFQSDIAETRVLIRRDDLANGLFERAWVICTPN